MFKNLVIKSIGSDLQEMSSGSDMIISGYASVYNVVDNDNDIIMPGAFSQAINEASDIKLLWQHDIAKPVGIINSLVEDDYGLLMTAVINTNTSIGKDAIELIKQGAIKNLSIGFTIELEDYNNQNQRLIKKAKLYEISIVSFPANNQAKILEIQPYRQLLQVKQLYELSKALDSINHNISQIHHNY